MKDSFRTIGYKSGWIHTHHDRDLGKSVVQVQLADYSVRDVVSVRAAKIRITRSER